MKKILLMIDMQNDFITNVTCAKLSYDVREFIVNADFDYVIGFYYNSDNNNSSSWKVTGSKLYINRLHKDLVKYCDVVLSHTEYNCLSNRKLLEIMRTYNGGELPEEVYLCGLDTDACVYETAIALSEIGIKPILIKDLCFSSGGLKYHEAALMLFKRNISSSLIKDSYEIIDDQINSLKDLRVGLGMSQVQFANKIGMSLSYVQKVEQGYKKPTDEVYLKIINRLIRK